MFIINYLSVSRFGLFYYPIEQAFVDVMFLIPSYLFGHPEEYTETFNSDYKFKALASKELDKKFNTILSVLTDWGLSINYKDKSGNTLLMYLIATYSDYYILYYKFQDFYKEKFYLPVTYLKDPNYYRLLFMFRYYKDLDVFTSNNEGRTAYRILLDIEKTDKENGIINLFPKTKTLLKKAMHLD